MASNYEVNIKLDTKQATDQLRKLEERITKLNKLSQGGRASRTVNLEEKEKLKAATKKFQIETRTTREQKRQTLETRKQLKLEQQIANTVSRQTSGSRGGGGGNRPKGKGIVTSALISGSFPLLFGQGIPGAIAGGLGGGIGAKYGGQMGGFAGGLVATAALQIFNNIKDSVNQFGAELNDPTKNLDALTERIKTFDKSIETSVNTLKNAGLDQVAGELASLTMQQQFKGLDSVQELNKEMTKFQQGAAALTTRLSILVAGPLTLLFKTLNLISGSADSANRDLTTSGEIAVQQDKLNKDLKQEEFYLEQLEIERKKLADLDPNTLYSVKLGHENIIREIEALLAITRRSISENQRLLDIRKLQRDILLSEGRLLEGQIELEKIRAQITRGTEDEKTLALKQKQIDMQKVEQKLLIANENLKSLIAKPNVTAAEIEAQEEKIKNLEREYELTQLIANERINAADPAISRMDELNREMRDLNNVIKQSVELSKAMGESFSDSFKGIVDGTITVQDAFRNMLNRIADFFLDTAAQMAANQLQRSLLGLFGNMFNFSTKPMNDIQGYSGGPPKYAANGGPVGMRNPYIVGERGPELFVPNQSGNIIPNHDLAGVGGGSISVVVNVDASGTSVEGNEANGEELGRLIGAVVQSELIKEKRPGGLLS